jgi:ribosomal protein L7/L12
MPKFDVVVSGVAQADQTELVKQLRVIGALELAEAKAVAAFARQNEPCTLAAGLDREVADHVAGLLAEAGAKSAIMASSATAPQFLSLAVNGRYVWSRLHGRVAAE